MSVLCAGASGSKIRSANFDHMVLAIFKGKKFTESTNGLISRECELSAKLRWEHRVRSR